MKKETCVDCGREFKLEDLYEVFINEDEFVLICEECLKEAEVFYCDYCTSYYSETDVRGYEGDCGRTACEFCYIHPALDFCFICGKEVYEWEDYDIHPQHGLRLYHLDCLPE